MAGSRLAAWRRSINSHESFTHDSIDGLGYDWSRVGDPSAPFRPPFRVYLPRSTADVVRCVKEAVARGERLTVRANGHSSNDLVTPEGGSVLLTRYLNRVLDVDETALKVTVQAGAASADVDDELATRGLGLRVIGDHAHVTVGGFASVGGISASSFRHGMFVDAVESLEYVDWSGRVARCGRDDDPDTFAKLLGGLGRHGVITALTIAVERVDKYGSYWHNRRTHYRSLDDFLAAATSLVGTNPPADARFIRGLWIDMRRRGLGQFSVYTDVPATPANRVRDGVAYTALHALGAVAGRLPARLDRALKYAGVAGIVLSPRAATIKNAESFSDRIIDASVGDPTRYLVAIARASNFGDVSRRLLSLLRDYREREGCFKSLTLYLKGIKSPYLARGRDGDDRWVEVLYLVAVDPRRLTPSLLDRIASEFDDVCIDTGSYRYLHSHTSRDARRLALIDPSAGAADGIEPWPGARAPEEVSHAP